MRNPRCWQPVPLSNGSPYLCLSVYESVLYQLNFIFMFFSCWMMFTTCISILLHNSFSLCVSVYLCLFTSLPLFIIFILSLCYLVVGWVTHDVYNLCLYLLHNSFSLCVSVYLCLFTSFYYIYIIFMLFSCWMSCLWCSQPVSLSTAWLKSKQVKHLLK